MLNLWLCIGFCAIIWIFNGICFIHAIKEKIISELYMHIGLAIFLSVMVLELTLGNNDAWKRLDSLWLQITGFILYIPSGYLVITSMVALKQRGQPEGKDFTLTTIFIDKGIYLHIRQPMTLGLAIWCLAFIFVFQSILSLVLCVISMFCFWMAARKESDYNIRKFGDDYKAYMEKVPMWNLFRRL